MHPLVFNVHKKQAFDIYVGRSKTDVMHFGNPFSHMNVAGTVKVDSREEAIECFRLWIAGAAYEEIDPDRRRWIIDNLSRLKGKKLGCFCAPLGCHGDVLAELAEKT